jgi:hypothetical protein
MESMIMKAIQILNARASGHEARHGAAFRPRVRRAPRCETLEGRQLLSTVASGMPAWASRGGSTAADIAHAHSGNEGGHDFHGTGSTIFAHEGGLGSFARGGLSGR